MRGRRLALLLYVPLQPLPCQPCCASRAALALFSPPRRPRGPGALGIWRPCVMTHMRAKTWGRRRAVESVSFRVCLAPHASSVLPGVSRPFPRAVAWGAEGMRGASRHFPGPRCGPGWWRASAFWAPWSSPGAGWVLPAASRPGVPSSAQRPLLGADRPGNYVLGGWGWLCGSFKRFLRKAGS